MRIMLFIATVLFVVQMSAQSVSSNPLSDAERDSLFIKLFLSYKGLNVEEALLFKKRVDGLLENILRHKNFQKGEDQRIKFAYDEIHKNLLNQYELEAYFPDLVRKGTYNCVTGTALVAYAMERFRIPYEIKLIPGHVYLVAYPLTHPIRVEVTTPAEGTLEYNDSFKKTFVDYLTANKLVAKSDIETKSTGQIFKENIDKNETISFSQILGAQYFNQALYAFDKEQMTEAFENVEKAIEYFPSPKTKVMFTGIAAKLIMERRYKNPDDDLNVLVKMIRNDTTAYMSNMVVDEFKIFTNLMLEDRGALAVYTNSSEKFITQISDSTIKAQVSQVFFLSEARQHYLSGDFSTALSYAERSYQLNPENANNETVLTDVIARNLSKISSIEKLSDTLEAFSQRYPKLNSNVAFKSMLGSAYLFRASSLYESGKIKSGEKYRSAFEAAVKPDQAHNIQDQVIVDFYTNLCFQYFRGGMQAQAVKALQTGLKYVPNEPTMLRRLSSIR